MGRTRRQEVRAVGRATGSASPVATIAVSHGGAARRRSQPPRMATYRGVQDFCSAGRELVRAD